MLRNDFFVYLTCIFVVCLLKWAYIRYQERGRNALYKMSVKKMTALAMLVALNIIMAEVTKFPLIPKVLELSFGFVPVAMAGMLFGPVTAMLVSGVADVIGAVLAGVEFFPGYTLSAVLSGLFYGLTLHKQNASVWRIALGQLLVSLIVYAGCNTLWAYMMGYGRSMQYVVTRFTVNAVSYPVYVFILYLMMRYRRTFERAVK